ncbi:MAG: PLP-dependent transferase [Bacteroidetes bacterium]|nr:PLP-dependent transferase [Bacteroidota bacterium]MCB0842644.1 PLP-dependent transferase [Bacteroidota bacterium]
MMKDLSHLHLSTLAIHAGESPDPHTKASSPNLVMSTTFVADPDSTFSVEGLEEDAPFFYTRWGNPTVAQLEQKLAALEGVEDCITFASGMAAITALMLHTLSQGDHILISDVTYAAAAELTLDLLPRMGISVTRVNMSDPEKVREAISPQTKLIYAETPCNPLIRLTDIQAISSIAKRAGILLAVDSTFATPVATQPIELGADLVIHSLTKYIGGHGDAVGGALLGKSNLLAQIRQKIAIRTGGIISPFNAWLIMRGMATLPIRMMAHEKAAKTVADFLENHPKVTRVIYPGLPSHPQYDLAKRQMKNFSGMISFQVKNGPEMARQLAERLQVIHYAVSLGHHRSLIFYLPTRDMLQNSFHLNAEQAKAYREYAGEGIFRLSVGIEDGGDLCGDLERALE